MAGYELWDSIVIVAMVGRPLLKTITIHPLGRHYERASTCIPRCRGGAVNQ